MFFDTNLINDAYPPHTAQAKPGVGLVVRVAAWDPRVLSSSLVAR